MFAHRGISSLYPENSLQAISKLFTLKEVEGTEFDVVLSKDGKPMLIHQETFKPSPDLQKIFQSPAEHNLSWTEDYDYAELSQMDSGSWFGPKFFETRIATLQEALALDWKQKTALIELKDALYWESKSEKPYHRKIVEAVKDDILTFHKAGNETFILSFSAQILKVSAREMPSVPRVQSATNLEILRELSGGDTDYFSSFCTSETIVLNHPEVVSIAHDLGKQLIVYEHTTYEKNVSRDEAVEERKSVWEKFEELQVDAIISNYSEEY